MSQFPIGFNPNLPGGNRLNRSMGLDLTDPSAFLDQLARLKSDSVGPMPTAKKKPPQQAAVMQPPPASTTPPSTTTPPASTTPTTPVVAPPPVVSPQGSVGANRWKDQRDAANAAYTANPKDPNAGNRLRRELGRISAEEHFAKQHEEFRQQMIANNNARRDAEAKRRAENIDRAWTSGRDFSNTLARDVSSGKYAGNAQYDPESSMRQVPRAPMDPAAAAADRQSILGPVRDQRDWLDHAISNAIRSAQELKKTSPTGQLSSLTDTPSTLADTGRAILGSRPGAIPSEYNYRTPRGEFVGPLDFEARPTAEPGVGSGVTGQPPEPQGVGSGTTGQPIEPQGRPWSPSPQQQDEQLRRAIAARDQQMAFTDPRVTLPTMDPAITAATKAVGDRYRAQGVDPMDPDVRAKFDFDVNSELARIRPNMGAGAQTIGAPLQLTDNGRVGAGEAAWESLKGLVGPEIPPELRQRELDTATTTRGRDLAQIGQYNDATKQATLDALVAGEMGTRRSSGGPAGNTSPSVVDRRNEPGAPVDERIHTMTPNASQAQEISQHMIENPDAGAGIGVQRRRETPSPYQSYSHKPSPVEEFLDTIDRIKNPNRETVGNVRRRDFPYGETGFDPATGQGFLPMNFEQMDTRAPHPSRVGMPVTGTPLPPAELTPEARRLREDIPFTPRDNVPGQMTFDNLRTQRSDERVAELRSADRKFDANARQQARADKAIAELAKAGFFGSDNPSPVKLPPAPPDAIPLGPIGPQGMKMPAPPFPGEKADPVSQLVEPTPAAAQTATTPKLSEALKSDAPSELVQPSKEPLPGQEPKVTKVEEPAAPRPKAKRRSSTKESSAKPR